MNQRANYSVQSSDIHLNPAFSLEASRKAVSQMNLIDNFLFENVFFQHEDARTASSILLSCIMRKPVVVQQVIGQLSVPGIDTDRRGIRMDAYVLGESADSITAATTTAYDIEPDKTKEKAPGLPKRSRYYSSIIDARLQESGIEFDKILDVVSIFITSYDPFQAGDMYYEAGTRLITHPDIPYNDGVRRIFLYCDGRVDEELLGTDGNQIHELLQYICHGTIDADNSGVQRLDHIVQRVKEKREVNRTYMRTSEMEYEAIKRGLEKGLKQGLEQGLKQGLEQGRKEARIEDAMIYITSLRSQFGATDAQISAGLTSSYGFTAAEANELLSGTNKLK